MMALRFTAMTAASALGIGRDATIAALRDRRGGLAPCTLPGMPAGIWAGEAPGRALPPALAAFDCRNHRLAEAALAADGFAEAVAASIERYGATRIATILGTSTSGIAETEHAYARRGADGALADYDYDRSHDLHALPRYVRARLGLRGPAFSLSTACTSGAFTFIEAARIIEAGLADAVVAGGADSLCRLTLHGFASLELLSRAACRPCAGDRDGITIGEAAAFILLERAAPRDSSQRAAPRDGSQRAAPRDGSQRAAPRDGSQRATPRDGGIGLLGAGASSDGHHMSTPHPEGLGAVAAMRAALASAGLSPRDIDLIALHGTGTRANDAMEDRAVASLFGGEIPASSTKGFTGHTLGASGALEAVIAALCIEHGLAPGCLGIDKPDPAFSTRILTRNEARPLHHVLKNAFGFGGSNCSLVIGRLP